MEWQLDGNYGFLNEEMLNTPVDGVFTYARPDKIGYMIVKVTGKTTPNTKYRVAMITREIVPSEATSRNIYNEANKFAGQNRTHAELVAAAQEQNLSVRNAMVRSMDYKLSGINNARSIIQWAYNEKTEIGTVADQIFESDDMYIVASLKEVFEKGTPELAQVRPMIEQQVRLEMKKDILMARAEEAASAKDINAIATKLGTTVDSVSNISFNSYYFDKFGMEPKVLATIAATKGNKLIGPIKGASGIYMVQIDNVQPQPAANDIAAVRAGLEQSSMQKLRGLTTVLKDKAEIVDQRHLFF